MPLKVDTLKVQIPIREQRKVQTPELNLMGPIIMLGSVFLGFSLTCSYLEIWAKNFITLPQRTSAYLVIIGACAFVGLITCLNLVMHGLNYNKLNKLEQIFRKGKF